MVKGPPLPGAIPKDTTEWCAVGFDPATFQSMDNPLYLPRNSLEGSIWHFLKIEKEFDKNSFQAQLSDQEVELSTPTLGGCGFNPNQD